MITIVPLAPTRSSEDASIAMKLLLDQLAYQPSRPAMFIKPNMVDATLPMDAVDTDPAVVGGLILALKEKGASEFVIGDGTGYFTDEKNWSRLVEETGYQAMVNELESKHDIKARLVNLESAPRVDVPWRYGTLKLPTLCKTHAYINVAKMKTHVHSLVSLSTKNQKGLLALADKKAFHLGKKYGNLNENILALGQAMQPELAIIDATRCLEGSGPTTAPGGQTKVRRLKCCIGATSMLEADIAACQVMGIPVGDVKHLQPGKFVLAAGSQPLVPADPPFARPRPEIMVTDGFFVHMCETCCTGCQMARSRLFRKISFTPEVNQLFAKFRHEHGRVDFIMGTMQNEEIDQIAARGGTLVFFGNCTKPAAAARAAIHIGGCPPDHNLAIRELLGNDA